VTIVWLLLRAPGIDLNAVSMSGNTALHFAIASGCAEVVEMLLQREETEVNAAGPGGATALHGAVASNQGQCVEMLCRRRDLDVNARTEPPEMITPLMLAANNGDREIVQMLLACPGVETDARLANGTTAVDIALGKGFEECADMIRDAGAPPAREVREMRGERNRFTKWFRRKTQSRSDSP
jgi:ankyrin repeat protein